MSFIRLVNVTTGSMYHTRVKGTITEIWLLVVVLNSQVMPRHMHASQFNARQQDGPIKNTPDMLSI